MADYVRRWRYSATKTRSGRDYGEEQVFGLHFHFVIEFLGSSECSTTT